MKRRVFICGAFSAALAALLLPKKTFADGGIVPEPHPRPLIGEFPNDAADYIPPDVQKEIRFMNVRDNTIHETRDITVAYADGHLPLDIQFLETRQFRGNEIARIFRVPVHKIKELDKARV